MNSFALMYQQTFTLLTAAITFSSKVNVNVS